jgi:acetyl-CoA carboxylase biotin carboxylase subunit
MTKPTKILVANRSAVASRVIRALNQLGIPSVAVYSEADKNAPYLNLADDAIFIGEAPAAKSYLNEDVLFEAMSRTGATALHPGYGFLSENPVFAQKVIDAGHVFVGPSPQWIEKMGHKTQARDFAKSVGWPIGSGSELLPDDDQLVIEMARSIGYPLIVKPAEGGGGIGMLVAQNEDKLLDAVERARSMAKRGFGSEALYLESLCVKPRHVEFQVIGDKHGDIRVLFERDCSIQRRHQKIIEEAIAPGIDRSLIQVQCEGIARGLGTLGYDSLGTVEMLFDSTGQFRFLEMNTRLQVEHGVTEEVLGIDLVQSQIRIALGERLKDVLPDDLSPQGHSIQARIYAEDSKRFYPSPGKLQAFEMPVSKNIRVETGYCAGMDVTQYYDPLLAKVIVHAPNRSQAIIQLIAALRQTRIEGLSTNIEALIQIIQSDSFMSGNVHTDLAMEVVQEANRKRA